MAPNNHESTLLRQFAKQQFERRLLRHSRGQVTPSLSLSPEETKAKDEDGQKMALSLESYNHKFRLVLDSQAGLKGLNAYKFVPLEQESSSSSSKSELSVREVVTTKEPLPLITLPISQALPAVSVPQILPEISCPPFTVNIEPPPPQVQGTKAKGEKGQKKQTNRLELERPSSARSNVSRRSTRSRRASICRRDHWVDNLTISEPDETRQEASRFRKRRQSAMLKARRMNVDDDWTHQTALPTFICPSSQQKSHVYMCGLWVLQTNFQNGSKTTPLA